MNNDVIINIVCNVTIAVGVYFGSGSAGYATAAFFLVFLSMPLLTGGRGK